MLSSPKCILLSSCLWWSIASWSLAQEEQSPAGRPPATEKAKDSGKKDKEDKKKDKGKDKDKKGKDKAKDGAKKKQDSTGDPTEADGNPERLSLPMLVTGHDSKGLKIPYYDAQRNLQMVYNIGVATRLDNDHVQMQQMQVETYNEEGEVEMTIDLPTSVLDLNTRVVTSKTKTTITREDFVITGDSVEFNTANKQGTLVGNVHMIINNLNEEAIPPTEEQPDVP